MFIQKINFNQNQNSKQTARQQNLPIKYHSQPKCDTVSFGNLGNEINFLANRELLLSKTLERAPLQLRTINEFLQETIETLPRKWRDTFAGATCRVHNTNPSFFISNNVYPAKKIPKLLVELKELGFKKSLYLRSLTEEKDLPLAINAARDFNHLSEGIPRDGDISNLDSYILDFAPGHYIDYFDYDSKLTPFYPEKTHFGIDVSGHDNTEPDVFSMDYFSDEMVGFIRKKFNENNDSFRVSYGGENFVVTNVQNQANQFAVFDGIKIGTLR